MFTEQKNVLMYWWISFYDNNVNWKKLFDISIAYLKKSQMFTNDYPSILYNCKQRKKLSVCDISVFYIIVYGDIG